MQAVATEAKALAILTPLQGLLVPKLILSGRTYNGSAFLVTERIWVRIDKLTLCVLLPLPFKESFMITIASDAIWLFAQKAASRAACRITEFLPVF